jgi:glycerol-3-phosphate dehydrogenase
VVAGGKYTTYRVMAKDAVDEAVHGLERSMDRRIPESTTKHVPLLGAEGYDALWNSRHRLSESSGLHLVRIEHLMQRYGSLIDELLQLIAEDRTLAEPLEGTDDYLRAEVVYAVTHEGARHLDDVLTRRTRISIETFHRGTASAEDTAALMAGALGWSDEQRDREVEHYLQRVAAERESQEMPDDQTADAARLGAPDVVPLT